MLAKTDQLGIVRDLNNNALLANDISSLHSHREEFRRKQEMNNKLNDINIMKEQIRECLSLRDELQEIKQMLNIYIQRDNQWHSQV
ncbi:MAG: hypothetical protein QGH83_07240 [Candidatus Pacebacteria bacterium]|jgi:hypothetical protein|nr:hypothetical protein [Candidatus Paceibacterota bacterium]|tara:strand:- start:530 stop:787 length:258 start_codon:yes stop_codon:yes gene_type:complete